MKQATDTDLGEVLARRVAASHGSGRPLRIRGGDSKAFLDHAVDADPLDLRAHQGVVAYEPAELVVTARAGTPLAHISEVLGKQGQCMAFEPPEFGGQATLGGALAAGLSGPRRPFAGAARDFVLGMRIINGRGEMLRFGGQVMKNVAGYDLSRLMVGAMGTLGIILEASLKVLPLPQAEATLTRACSQAEGIRCMNSLIARSLPLSGGYWEDGLLYLRMSGALSAVETAFSAVGGDRAARSTLWTDIRELRRPLMANADTLWRVSVPPATPPLSLPGSCAVDWAGAVRWYATTASAAQIREQAWTAGGHAVLYRGGNESVERFQSPGPGIGGLQQRLKQAMDPARILNPGRLYADL